MTMNIGAFSLGTETMGSIVSPASHQSVVGFKPTHSSVSGEGVLPLAPSLDTVGPIARSVVDAAQGFVNKQTRQSLIKEIIQTTIKKAQQTFDALLKKQQLDGYAFIDSEGTGLSAVAGYPELTVPLAKNSEGQPYGLTFTQTANKEQTLFKQAYSFEQSTKGRIVLSDNELLANSKKINRDEQ